MLADETVQRAGAAGDWGALQRGRGTAQGRKLDALLGKHYFAEDEIARRCSYEKGCFYVRQDILRARARFAAEMAAGGCMTTAVAATAIKAAQHTLKEVSSEATICDESAWSSERSAASSAGGHTTDAGLIGKRGLFFGVRGFGIYERWQLRRQGAEEAECVDDGFRRCSLSLRRR